MLWSSTVQYSTLQVTRCAATTVLLILLIGSINGCALDRRALVLYDAHENILHTHIQCRSFNKAYFSLFLPKDQQCVDRVGAMRKIAIEGTQGKNTPQCWKGQHWNRALRDNPGFHPSPPYVSLSPTHFHFAFCCNIIRCIGRRWSRARRWPSRCSDRRFLSRSRSTCTSFGCCCCSSQSGKT